MGRGESKRCLVLLSVSSLLASGSDASSSSSSAYGTRGRLSFFSLQKNSQGFLSSGRGGVFELDWALVEVQAAQSLVFFPSACKTPVLVCLVASPKQTREAQADSHHTALSRIFYIYFIFYPFPFFLSFFFCHWFLFLIEWRVAKHRAKCRILFFPVKKQCVYKVYMSCKMRPLILTCCIKVIWLIFLILPSLLIFQPIPRAPASAPCSSPSCPSSSSSSPCRSPYASRSRRVPAKTCLTLFETKTRADFAQRPAPTSGKQGWQNLAKY